MITCKNDRLLELLWFVGYCIEFPTQLAVRIGGGAEWNRRVMYRAIREGYVKLFRKKHQRHVIRSLSLTEKGFDYVAQGDPEAWAMIHSRINNSDPVYPAWIDIMIDSDYQDNDKVRTARDRYIELGAAAGFEVAPITWSRKQKGIDDLYKHLFRDK